MKFRIIAAVVAGAALIAGTLACGDGTPSTPSTGTTWHPVRPTVTSDLGSETPGAPCATSRLGKTFVKRAVTYTCGGNRPYHWMRSPSPSSTK